MCQTVQPGGRVDRAQNVCPTLSVLSSSMSSALTCPGLVTVTQLKIQPLQCQPSPFPHPVPLSLWGGVAHHWAGELLAVANERLTM